MNRVINVDNRGEVMIPEDPQPAWYQVLDEERTASRPD